MNKLLLILLSALLTIKPALSITIEPVEQVTLAGRTIYLNGGLAEPDSLRIQVFRNGSELHDDWYNSADAQVSAVDGWLLFTDQFQDIDGVGGDGQYLVLVRAYDNDSALYTPFVFDFQVGMKRDIISALDSLSIILDSLRNHDDWVSSLTVSDNIGINLNDVTGTLDSSEIGPAALNSQKIAPNSIGDVQLAGSASTEIAFGIWNYATRNITGGVVDSNRTEGAVDSTSLARAVWNTPQSNHIIAGTFGKYLDREISGIGIGDGLYSVGIFAYDSTIDQAVPGVSVAIRNSDQSALIAAGNCNFLGRLSFNLDADTFIVLAYASGYIFASPDTLVVSGALVDTIYGYRFDPGTAEFPGLCRVYGFLYDLAGIPETGAEITARIPSGVIRAGGGIVSPFEIVSYSDSTGYFYLDLIPNALLLPDTTRYEITVRLDDGTVLREKVIVPNQPDWLLTW